MLMFETYLRSNAFLTVLFLCFSLLERLKNTILQTLALACGKVGCEARFGQLLIGEVQLSDRARLRQNLIHIQMENPLKEK